jgi:hypothetical protein
MSKFHGEQYWTTVRHQTLHSWRNLDDDDFEPLSAINHDREVRERIARGRKRGYGRGRVASVLDREMRDENQ